MSVTYFSSWVSSSELRSCFPSNTWQIIFEKSSRATYTTLLYPAHPERIGREHAAVPGGQDPSPAYEGAAAEESPFAAKFGLQHHLPGELGKKAPIL